METIIGQFPDMSRVEGAIDALLERKYDKSDISFVASDVTGGNAVTEARTPAVSIGSALLGLLGGSMAMMIPGPGPLLAAGSFAVGLAGTASGAVQQDIDHFGATLGQIGVPEQAARAYGGVLRDGGALVLVRAREVVGDNIEGILRSSGAVAVHRHPRDEHDATSLL